MGDVDTNGHRALEDLVCWRGQLADLIKAACQQDTSTAAVLDRVKAADALEKVITGQVSPEDLTKWAETVHFLDGVDIEEGQEDLLAQVLFEISTPELFEPVTAEVCQRWLSRIRTSIATSRR
jgi:hypothetical protein